MDYVFDCVREYKKNLRPIDIEHNLETLKSNDFDHKKEKEV